MKPEKLTITFLSLFVIAGIAVAVEPNDCNEVHSYGYGYESDYNKDCRVDAADLNEITSHWALDYAQEPPNLPGLMKYEDEVMDDGPALWLRFENGNNPCDDSGNDYWVEYGDNTSIVPEGGGIGNSIYFIGGTGSYVAAANQQTEPKANDIIDVNFGHQYGFTEGDTTWEFWYRGVNVPELPEYAIFFNQNWRGDEEAVCLTPIYGMAGRAPDGSYTYTRYTTNVCSWGYANQNPAMAIPLDNGWHHIVMSWDEKIYDANRMGFRLCIDGCVVKSAEYPDTSPIPGLVGGDRGEMDHIVIGAGGWRDAQADNSTLIGYMDEFAIYPYILGEDRILAHYYAGQPMDCNDLVYILSQIVPPPMLFLIDRNQDCRIDFYDFTDFALEWALCNDPQGGPGCVPNW